MVRALFLFLFCLPLILIADGDSLEAKYPIPPVNEHTLFYIQRSKNVNAIMYEANVLNDGTLDKDEPVKIFWIRYTSDSSQAPLTFIQNKYAYGIKAEEMKDHSGEYILKFVSYDKRWIYLKRETGGHYAAYMFINGTFAELNKIFISLGQGTFWFPTVEYVEVSGKDISTQKPLTEKFIPK